jgi:hypothetical protein
VALVGETTPSSQRRGSYSQQPLAIGALIHVKRYIENPRARSILGISRPGY